MPLTRDFKATVQARVLADPAFREALLKEGIAALSGAGRLARKHGKEHEGMSKKHHGSSLDAFLKAEGVYEDTQARVIAEVAALKADIAKGLADLEAGRTKAFEPAAIIKRGRRLQGTNR